MLDEVKIIIFWFGWFSLCVVDLIVVLVWVVKLRFVDLFMSLLLCIYLEIKLNIYRIEFGFICLCDFCKVILGE